MTRDCVPVHYAVSSYLTVDMIDLADVEGMLLSAYCAADTGAYTRSKFSST